MKISYDKQADSLYIEFIEEKVDHTSELDENTIIDYDNSGKVIGVELLFVKEKNPSILDNVKLENLN